MSKTHFSTGLILAVAMSAVCADPSSQVVWTPELLARVKHGDVLKGKEVADSCASCHAIGNEPEGSQYPSLQGQLATYLYKQLQDYRNGSRAHANMTGVAASLSEEEVVDVAAFYASQNPPQRPKSLLPNDIGEALVEKGDSKRILPPCEVCHEPNGRGQRIDVPALAGQNAAYLEQTLLDYKRSGRHNDLYGRMRGISEQLSETEIKELARYYTGR